MNLKFYFSNLPGEKILSRVKDKKFLERGHRLDWLSSKPDLHSPVQTDLLLPLRIHRLRGPEMSE